MDPNGPERKMFLRLVVDLEINPHEAMRVIAFWTWLREIGRSPVDIIRHVLILKDDLAGSMINEAFQCMNWMQSLTPPPPPSLEHDIYDSPLTALTLGQRDFSFKVLYEMRHTGMRRIAEMVEKMCTTHFRDIIVNEPPPPPQGVGIPEDQDTTRRENVNEVVVQMDGPTTQANAPVVASCVGGSGAGSFSGRTFRVGGQSSTQTRGAELSGLHNSEVGGPYMAPTRGGGLSGVQTFEVGGPSWAPTTGEGLSAPPEVGGPSWAPTRGGGLSRSGNVPQQDGVILVGEDGVRTGAAYEGNMGHIDGNITQGHNVVPIFASAGSGFGFGHFSGSSNFLTHGGPSFAPRIGEGLSRYGSAPQQGGILERQVTARRGEVSEASMVQLRDQRTEAHNIAPVVASVGGGGGSGVIGFGPLSGPSNVGRPSFSSRGGGILSRSGNINDDVERRTMYFTFTRENPVTLTEFRSYFTVLYGGESIDSVFIQQARERGEPPLFARIVFQSVDIVRSILQGNEKVEFTVNGKPVWSINPIFI